MSLGNRFFSHLLGLLVLLTALPAAAEEEEDPLVAQATRQLELARSDLESGAYERAVKACDSALRLDPTNREAFKIKGLALHKLDKLDDAQAMLMAYESLRSGLPPDPEVAEIMEKIRIKKALVLGDGPLLTPLDLGFEGPVEEKPRWEALSDAKESFQTRYIKECLEAHEWNKAATARALDVDPRTIFRYIEKFRND